GPCTSLQVNVPVCLIRTASPFQPGNKLTLVIPGRFGPAFERIIYSSLLSYHSCGGGSALRTIKEGTNELIRCKTAMQRSMLKSKLHRLTVTHADLNYEGSLTVDVHLLEAADILPFEEVHIWNVTRGTRLRTYAMAGERGSGIVCANGAAAHLVQPGD